MASFPGRAWCHFVCVIRPPSSHWVSLCSEQPAQLSSVPALSFQQSFTGSTLCRVLSQALGLQAWRLAFLAFKEGHCSYPPGPVQQSAVALVQHHASATEGPEMSLPSAGDVTAGDKTSVRVGTLD